MPRTLQDTLSHLPTEVLRDLARAHRIDRGRQAERTLLIETLLSLPDPDAVVVEADRRRMEYRLGRLRPRQLRDLGERHRVSLHGLKKKWDLVEALASAPDASEILMELEAQAPAERDAGLILGRDSSVDFARVGGCPLPGGGTDPRPSGPDEGRDSRGREPRCVDCSRRGRMEARGRLPGPGSSPGGTGELPGGRPARGRRPGAPDTGRGGFGRVRIEPHRTRPERRRGDGGSRTASCRGPPSDRRGRAWSCGRPAQAGRTARDEGPTEADRTGDPPSRGAGRESSCDSHRMRTGPQGSRVVRPRPGGGPDVAPAGTGRPDEGRLSRRPHVRAECGRGHAATRGANRGRTPPPRNPETPFWHLQCLPIPTGHLPRRWMGPLQ